MLKVICFYTLVFLCIVSKVCGAPGDIKTIAGNLAVDYNGLGHEKLWFDATSVFIDEDLSFYITDASKHRIVKIDSDSARTIIAGLGWPGYSGDGALATDAEISEPSDILQNSQGEILFADTGNHCIRKIDTNGMIHTIAGNGIEGFSGDGGPAQNAQLSSPKSIFLDQDNHLYIADTRNHRIRKVNMDSGIITTVVGDGYKDEKGEGRFSGDDGLALEASLFNPTDVFVDSTGTMYIADSENQRIRKVSPQGHITTVPGTLLTHRSYKPQNLLVQENKLYFSDFHLYCINLISETIDTFNTKSVVQDIFVDSHGERYISQGHTLLKQNHDNSFSIALDQSRTRPTVKTYYGDEQSASEAGIYKPRSIWADSESNIYIADTGNHRIRKITPDGIITTIAGNGTEGFSGDGGPASQASMSKPYDICGDTRGNLYIADMGNNRIRKIDAQGIISTIAGNGESITVVKRWTFIQDPPEMPEDVNDNQPATQALLRTPMGVAIDASNNLYIADTGHHRIRKVDASGIIKTVAGNGFGIRRTFYDAGTRARHLLGEYSGDGGSALSAHLDNPVDICFDQNGNLYIADSGNHRIRMVEANTDTIMTVAGDGNTFHTYPASINAPTLDIGKLKSEEYPALSSSLNFPMSVCTTPSGHVLIADSYNHRIRVILPQSGVLKTIAGASYTDNGDNLEPYPEFVINSYYVYNSEVGGYFGDDGSAINARLSIPSGIFIDQQGDLYIADTGNSRIRVIEDIQHTYTEMVNNDTTERSDFNNDKKIDFLDFITFARHFNSKKGEPEFNEICDLNDDSIIGFLDFLKFSNNFGKSYN